MQPETWQGHVIWFGGLIQPGQNALDLVDLIRPQLATVTVFKQQF